ncbi:MAG: cytochrome c oxidase accessory protein CcoG [Phycisphaerales bacterium]|nr:cytochrome c oxidase accessory protein CcoG [Phycisphaerales bacterium]
MATQASQRPSVPAPSDALQPKERVLSTLNKDGSRRWLAPRPMRGRFMSARRVVAIVLILVFTAIPYVRIGGHPLVLLDLPARRFTIFGMTFLPTDTLLLALFMVSAFVSIFLLTALLGRVWCGWACPQTVYLEFVFRPIERFFEGTPGRRQRWAFQGTPPAKVLKYITYFLVACYLAHTFLAYFVGVDTLWIWVRQSPFKHPAPFLVMAAVTALMLFDFSFFREQTCIVACPYGRFQSVLLDRDSLIITYDRARGEPRGKARRGKPQTAPAVPVALTVSAPKAANADGTGLGDCVDCGMCTVCCPTGIDIRDGLQLECVACAQCIDACDAVMAKLGRPLGLIRYSSERAVEIGRWHLLRPRVVLYPLLLIGLLTVFVTVLLGRGPFDLTVLRGLGRTFTTLPDGTIANPVQIKVVNRTMEPRSYTMAVEGIPNATLLFDENPVEAGPGEVLTLKGMIAAPASAFEHGRCPITVAVRDRDGAQVSRHFQLMGPTSASPPEEPDHSEDDSAHEPSDHPEKTLGGIHP